MSEEQQPEDSTDTTPPTCGPGGDHELIVDFANGVSWPAGDSLTPLQEWTFGFTADTKLRLYFSCDQAMVGWVKVGEKSDSFGGPATKLELVIPRPQVEERIYELSFDAAEGRPPQPKLIIKSKKTCGTGPNPTPQNDGD